jgi:hypothetical protein
MIDWLLRGTGMGLVSCKSVMYVQLRMVQEWRKEVLITSGSTADVDSRRYQHGNVSRLERMERSMFTIQSYPELSEKDKF